MNDAAEPGSPIMRAGEEVTARLKRADLASSAGAGILGFGVGLLAAESICELALRPSFLVASSKRSKLATIPAVCLSGGLNSP